MIAIWLLCLLSTACSQDAPTAVASSAPPTQDVAISPGPELTADDVSGTGFAWGHPAGIYLTTTSGLPVGHLPGWHLDREASDRMAAPVATDADGARFVLTADGAVPFGSPIPLAGAQLSIDDGAAAVLVDDAIVMKLPLTTDADLWISSTGTVVGVIGGLAYDVEHGEVLELTDGCRLADRHEDVTLEVCDRGASLRSSNTTIEAPAGSTWGFAVVGLTGNEWIATAHGPDGDAAYTGMGSSPSPNPIDANGILSYRQSGKAWVASFGAAGSLGEMDDAGAVEVLRELPGITDVVPLFR